MTKALLFAAFLGLAAQPAAAQTHVYETAQGTASVHNILVGDAAVQLDVSTRTVVLLDGMQKRFVLEIWNDDSTNPVFCHFNSNVSATATAANYGRRVSPRSSWTIAVPQQVKVYCISSIATGVRVLLTQLY